MTWTLSQHVSTVYFELFHMARNIDKSCALMHENAFCIVEKTVLCYISVCVFANE